jgi:hypothetical protein
MHVLDIVRLNMSVVTMLGNVLQDIFIIFLYFCLEIGGPKADFRQENQ